MSGQAQWQRVGDDAADLYERHLVPAMFAAWVPTLLEVAGVRSGEAVLDLACGTGVVARAAITQVGARGRVVGLDVNARMLRVARSSVGAGAAIEWCEASALAMPLPDESFDVVLCQQGLQQFADRPAALAEIRRVLVPDGRLAASVWASLERSPGFVALVAALARHVGAAAANNRRAPFALGDAAILRQLVEAAGFRNVSVRTLGGAARYPSPAAFVQYQLAASPLSTLAGVTEEAIGAVVDEVSDVLHPYVRDDGLVFPMEAHLVTARR